MREQTQDETVNEPYDGVHLVVILLLAGIGYWLHVPEWIVAVVQVAYLFVASYLLGQLNVRTIARYAAIVLLLLLVQKFMFS